MYLKLRKNFDLIYYYYNQLADFLTTKRVNEFALKTNVDLLAIEELG